MSPNNATTNNVAAEIVVAAATAVLVATMTAPVIMIPVAALPRPAIMTIVVDLLLVIVVRDRDRRDHLRAIVLAVHHDEITIGTMIVDVTMIAGVTMIAIPVEGIEIVIVDIVHRYDEATRVAADLFRECHAYHV
jgi:hypothetical protein